MCAVYWWRLPVCAWLQQRHRLNPVRTVCHSPAVVLVTIAPSSHVHGALTITTLTCEKVSFKNQLVWAIGVLLFEVVTRGGAHPLGAYPSAWEVPAKRGRLKQVCKRCNSRSMIHMQAHTTDPAVVAERAGPATDVGAKATA